jgi:anti-sigma regulatory factor (Ser/Thr protein kinase)
VTTDDLGDGLVQHHRLDLLSCDQPQALARSHVREALSGRTSASRIEDAIVVVCELVTNALQHTADGPVRMDLDVYEDTAIVCVYDGGRSAEVVRMIMSAADSESDLPEGGRGLYLVDVLTERWFVWPTERGKAVVAVMPLADAPQAPTG